MQTTWQEGARLIDTAVSIAVEVESGCMICDTSIRLCMSALFMINAKFASCPRFTYSTNSHRQHSHRVPRLYQSGAYGSSPYVFLLVRSSKMAHFPTDCSGLDLPPLSVLQQYRLLNTQVSERSGITSSPLIKAYSSQSGCGKPPTCHHSHSSKYRCIVLCTSPQIAKPLCSGGYTLPHAEPCDLMSRENLRLYCMRRHPVV